MHTSTNCDSSDNRVRHSGDGDIPHERPADKNDKCNPKSEPWAGSKCGSDDLLERSPTACGGRTDCHQIFGTPIVHDSLEPSVAHPEEKIYGIYEKRVVQKSSRSVATSIEEMQFAAEFCERVGGLETTGCFGISYDEMMSSVIESHTKAELCLRDLQTSCDKIQRFSQNMCKMMFEAEKTGQLEGSVRDEWRMYGEIVGHIDDYFLRRPDLMVYRKSQGDSGNKKASEGSKNSADGDNVSCNAGKKANKNDADGESNRCNSDGKSSEDSKALVAAGFMKAHHFPSISRTSWKLDDATQVNKGTLDHALNEDNKVLSAVDCHRSRANMILHEEATGNDETL